MTSSRPTTSSPSVSRPTTSSPQIRVIGVMLDDLPRAALVEVEAALARRLEPPPGASNARQHELGALARQLARSGPDAPRLTRTAYDAGRDPGDPSGRTLAARYGSWVKACRAAAALTRSSAAVGGPKARPTPSLGRRRPHTYTREEVIRAVREVARALDREPGQLSSSAYYEWVADRRQRARARGAEPPRLPTQRSVERHFDSWSEVLSEM